MNLENIYSILPSWAKDIAVNLEGYKIKRSRYSPGFFSLLEEAKKRTYWSKDEIIAFRNKRLRDFVIHCYQSVPYYQHKFKEWEVDPFSIKTLDDLSAKIPILTKKEVQDNINDLISDKIPKKDRITSHTSGTTGGGLHFLTTMESIQKLWAVWWRYRQWYGIKIDTWCGYFGGRTIILPNQNRPPFWRYNYPGKQIIFSSYHMSKDNLRYYIEELNRTKPLWLHGYPSLLSLLASYIIETGDKLSYKVKWITIGAENLLSYQKKLISDAFGINPIQHYGLAEAVANISQCEEGNLHVDEDLSAVEFIPNSFGSFKIIGTNFTNLAMPLLRYDTQDLAVPIKGSCSCGRPGRLVKQIDGRLEDYVILKNSAKIGRLDHIFKDLIMVREAQIYQEYPGKIEMRIVKREGYSDKDEKKLLKETYSRLGDIDISIKYVKSLERTKTGKLRFVISKTKEHTGI